jgi:hypothetical protein
MGIVPHWFRQLEDIWLRQDIKKIGTLVADEFTYYEEPFDDPIITADALVAEWQAVKAQTIEHLEIVPLVCTEREGTAHYHFIASIAGERHESRGAYYVRLDEQGRALEFRQWYVLNEAD